ncbi:general secretion pathway protein GspI [Dickeya dianthicola]|uniref:type II secretion system protein n=1 Tax=Dickeya dianthicola TaxID=204039 RepID=UPI001368B683|nr:type II secretion system protein [Dickeya dianthicola]MCI4238246.1 type II secretion system protein [Dickeya dianthicola]MCI4255311.1 type II secretion system protein [Dickeya dianthicola]MZG23002.1 general secretion pathway protein GspI [Dickeya dianthicola]MZI91142.1 general secretion pathway protein GspI [Dickeya dianthicola]
MTNNKKASGIVLLEVLIAVLILALCSGAILRAFSQEMALTAHTREAIIASWVADNLLVLAHLTPLSASGEPVSGSSIMGNQRWRWELGYTQETESSGIRLLHVRVFNATQPQPLVQLNITPP